MIKLKATALIHFISQVIDIPSRTGGNSFQKRDLVLNDSWIDQNNQEHPNFVLIEFTGDAMNALDNFQPGQRVTVDAYVNGREYNGRYFNTIRGQSIVPYQQPQPAPQMGYPQQAHQPYGAPAPASPFPQQMAPQPAYSPAPAYPQQSAYPQQGQPYSQQPGNLGVDQLPFKTQ